MSKANEAAVKQAVSVTEMARMVRLSRQRFYELVEEGVFLPPIYSLRKRRPVYTVDMQKRNLEVRTTQRGVNGEYVLFHDRPFRAAAQKENAASDDAKATDLGLMQKLKALGVADADPVTVAGAVRDCFPQGVGEAGEHDVLRALLRHFRRRKAS